LLLFEAQLEGRGWSGSVTYVPLKAVVMKNPLILYDAAENQ